MTTHTRAAVVEGYDPATMHQLMAATLDTVVAEIQRDARANGFGGRPRWPMIILRSMKGWTGPESVDGKPVEGTFRAHQVPVAALATKPEHLKILEQRRNRDHDQKLTSAKIMDGPVI